MHVCKVCQEEVEALIALKVSGKITKMCEECADREREKNEIAEASETVVQGMMGFTGRR
jgi:ribosome-binding protein aMBF1 (putative translation factor)